MAKEWQRFPVGGIVLAFGGPDNLLPCGSPSSFRFLSFTLILFHILPSFSLTTSLSISIHGISDMAS